jgi:hypothetical protein
MITDLTKGGGDSGITVIVNNLPGQDADTRPSEDGKRMEITIKRVKQEIASEFRRGAGDVNKSLSMRDKRMGVGK